MTYFDNYSEVTTNIKMCPKEEAQISWPSREVAGPSGVEYLQDKSDFNDVKSELKKEIFTRVEKDESDSDFDIKEEQNDEDSDSAESNIYEKKQEDMDLKPDVDNKSVHASYQRIFVQNYNSKMIEEEPIENVKQIFKESPLEFEKQKFHQNIFEKLIELSAKTTLKELQTQYITQLRQTAKLSVYSCTLCTYETINLTNLKCHLMILHKGKIKSEVFKCDTCQYETRSESCMNKHLTVHNRAKGKTKKKEKEEKHPCTEADCTFEGRSEEGLQRHLKTHHTDRSQCDLCSFRSQNKDALKEHRDTHKVGHKFHCYKCNYKNNCKVTLALHLLNVHKIANEASKRAKICEICSSAFSNTPLLLRHYISHKTISELNESEIHKCPQCNYQAKYKTSLNAHMVVHKAPEFICEVCGFATKHKKNYKEHLITHKKLDEIEWFRCDICPYQARNKKLLAKHIRKGDHSGKRLLHVRNRDRIREAEEKGEDINLIIKKFRIRKINGVKVKTERVRKNPKRIRKPRKKIPKVKNDLLEESNNLPGIEPGPSNQVNVQLFGLLPQML